MVIEISNLQAVASNAVVRPPWTFVNLVIYFATTMRDDVWAQLIRRASYVSMCTIVFSFYAALLLDSSCHIRLCRKQGLTLPIFYLFDVLLHWLPCWRLYVACPPFFASQTLCSVLSTCTHIFWGYITSGGTMNLSQVYANMHAHEWRILWCACCVFNFLIVF